MVNQRAGTFLEYFLRLKLAMLSISQCSFSIASNESVKYEWLHVQLMYGGTYIVIQNSILLIWGSIVHSHQGSHDC